MAERLGRKALDGSAHVFRGALDRFLADNAAGQLQQLGELAASPEARALGARLREIDQELGSPVASKFGTLAQLLQAQQRKP